MNKIYVKFEKPDTIEEFLNLFFSEKRGYSIHDYFCNVETYNDEACTDIQCYAGKNRSIDDLLDCVNTYFESTTIEELMNILVSLVIVSDNNIKYSMYNYYCKDIDKSVMWWARIGTNKPDLFRTCDTRGNSQWSWVELYEMMGITNQEEMDNHFKQLKEQYEEVQVN